VAKVETLTDTFDDNSTDTGLWGPFANSGTSYAETNGRVEFTLADSTGGPYAGYVSNATYDLTESAVYLQSVDPGTGDQGRTANLMAQIDGNNNVQLYRETIGGEHRIQASKKVAGSETYFGTVVVTSGPYWMRLREAGGTTYWEYSETGLSGSWTVMHSESDPITLTAITVQFIAGTWQAVAGPGVPKFDSLNTVPGGDAFQEDAFQGDAFQEPTALPGAYAEEVEADAPVGHWRLGEPSGTTAANASGAAPAGTYTNSFTLAAAGALVGDSDTALTLGGGGYVALPSDASLNITGPFTFECWLKTTDTGSHQNLWGGYHDGLWAGAGVRINFGQLGYYSSATGDWRSGPSGLNDGDWHHIVATVSGSTLIWYIDGAQSGSSDTGTAQPGSYSGPRAIGARSSGSTELLVGTIDEVAVYDTALSAARIAAHYEAGTTAGGGGPVEVNVAGGLTLAGGLTRTVSRSLAGGLTPTGATRKATTRALSGALTPAGAVSRQVAKALTGALSSAGALLQQAQRRLAGALTPAGALTSDLQAFSDYALEVRGTAGLVAYWQLEETAGLVAADSWDALPGVYETTPVTGGPLPFGTTRSQDFSGGQGVHADNAAGVVRQGTAISEECWVRTPTASSGGHRSIVSLRNDANQDFFVLLLSGGNTLECRLRVNGGANYDLTPTIPLDGGVHHVVQTYDSSTGVQTVYIDGAVAAQAGGRSGMPDSGTDEAPFRIGTDSNNNDWDGAIAHVALYDVALSAATVQDHYDAGTLAPAGTLALAGALSVVVPTAIPFRDDFTGAISPTWTETDTDGLIGVEHDRLAFTEGGGANWTDNRLTIPDLPRADLGAFVALARLTNVGSVGGGVRVSLSPSSTDPGASGAGSVHTDKQGADHQLWALGAKVSRRSNRSIDYLCAVVPRDGGGFLTVVSGGVYGAFPEATLVNVSDTEADATLHAHLATKQYRTQVDFAALLEPADLPLELTTRFGAALAHTASVTHGPSEGTLVDCGVPPRIIEATFTRTEDDSRCSLYFRSDGTRSQGFLFKGEFNQVRLEHAEFGLMTNTGAVTVPTDVPTHMRVVDYGDRIECFVDGAFWLALDSDYQNTNTYCGTAADFGPPNPIEVEDFACWGPVTLSSAFGPVPEPPAAADAPTVADSFTATDGTPLPTHNADWTVHSGTWEVNANKARMTAAGVQGLATRSAAGPNHQAKALITVPADPGAYPTDIFPGVVARRSAGGLLYACYLWQDGNSPEVELREDAGAGAQVVAPVNITGFLTAGDHELALACEGAEVAVYHDGELVTQYTTVVLTGDRAGIGVMDTNPGGQPAWDDFEIAPTALPTLLSLGGTLALAGALGRVVGRKLAGATAPTGALSRASSRRLAGGLTAAGALRRAATRAVSGALATAGGLATEATTGSEEFPVGVGGVLATAGALLKRAGRALAGLLAPAGLLRKEGRGRQTGTLAPTGTTAASRSLSAAEAGTLAPSGAVAVAPIRYASVQGTLGLAGALTLEVTLTPPPPAPEGVPLGEAAPPELLLAAEAGPAEGGVAAKTPPPEFRLRG
jgi:hypothetical protein